MDILFLSPADWNGVRGRFHHIASRLARHNRVLYVDGIGIRPIGFKMRDAERVLRRLSGLIRRHPKEPPRAELRRDHIDHIGPIALPFARSKWVGRINRALLSGAIGHHLRRRQFDDPLIWIAYPHPDLVPLLGRFSRGPVVYDCVDDWSEFSDVHADFAPAERALLRAANLVLATAPALLARAVEINPASFLVANGVDHDVFAGAAQGGPPEDVAAIAAPRIGFVGNIAQWVDLSLIEAVARRNPAWQFVFVGPWQRKEPRLRLANLHWLGTKPYSAVPCYLRVFDVAVIAFHADELTKSVDPLKIYEYLAAGRPVVATPLPAVSSDLAAFVSWAKTPVEFEAAIAAALRANNRDAEASRRAAVRQHSWDRRMAQIAELADRHLGVQLLPSNAEPST